MSMGGANAHRNRRMIRLCVDSGGSSLPQPIGRLGNFSGMGLTPNRRGAMSFAVAGSTLDFFSSTGRR